MRIILLFIALIGCGETMANERNADSSAYVNSLQAYTLQKGVVEFYEAYVVISNFSTTKRLIDDINGLCSKFPEIGGYRIKIFSEQKYANKKWLDESLKMSRNMDHKYIADYHPERHMLIFHPTSEEIEKVTDVSFCKERALQGDND